MNIEVPTKFKEIARETFKRRVLKLSRDYLKHAKKEDLRIMSEATIQIHLSSKTTYMDRDLYDFIVPTVKDYIEAKNEAKKLVEDLMAVA